MALSRARWFTFVLKYSFRLSHVSLEGRHKPADSCDQQNRLKYTMKCRTPPSLLTRMRWDGQIVYRYERSWIPTGAEQHSVVPLQARIHAVDSAVRPGNIYDAVLGGIYRGVAVHALCGPLRDRSSSDPGCGTPTALQSFTALGSQCGTGSIGDGGASIPAVDNKPKVY